MNCFSYTENLLIREAEREARIEERDLKRDIIHVAGAWLDRTKL